MVRRYVYPTWAKLRASEIARRDVKALIGGIAAQQVANQVKAAVSALFTFAVDAEVVSVNPCKGVRDNPTSERVLSAAEVPLFWAECEQVDPVRAAALRAIMLCGQRPGEVTRAHQGRVVGDARAAAAGAEVAGHQEQVFASSVSGCGDESADL